MVELSLLMHYKCTWKVEIKTLAMRYLLFLYMITDKRHDMRKSWPTFLPKINKTVLQKRQNFSATCEKEPSLWKYFEDMSF
jgi:hypothetical protein